jgi:hypothetical protein
LKVDAVSGANDQATIAGKEELARKLRRVASAPNAQGLFSKAKGSGDRPATAELGKEPLAQNASTSMLSLVDSKGTNLNGGTLGVPGQDSLGALQPPNLRNAMAFRRTYSSNSIKVRNVEVGPGSFDKIKLIGKGDVGKVYLVREKKSSRLYAMKGMFSWVIGYLSANFPGSTEQKGDDQAEQDQESLGRTRNPCNKQPSVHRYIVPLFPIGGSSVFVHGILQWWRVFQSLTNSAWEMYPGR